MTHQTPHFRRGRTALAAALALTTTPSLAQEAIGDPLAPTPVETPAEQPAASIPAAEPVATTPAPVDEPAEPAMVTPAAPRAERAARAPAKAAVTTRSASPSASTTAPASEPAAAPLAPAVEPTAEPLPLMADPPAPADPALVEPEQGAIAAAAGALVLFGLAGAALVGRRRRKLAHGNEPVVAAASVETPLAKTIRPGSFVTTATAPANRPAFAWGHAPTPAPAPAAAAGDRIAEAYRGPTPDNPSLSLKKRLKRATFFEQRDRAVRAGKAVPVAPDAGLPRRLAESVRKMSRPAAPRFQPAFEPA